MKRKKVLIVDGQPTALETLAGALNGQNYDVLTANDGGAAITTVRCTKPELILLAINFPPDAGHDWGVQWDGFLILNWLRRLEEAKGIPVIFLCESNPVEYRDRARAAGAVGLFHKSSHRDALLATIDQILARPAMTGATAASTNSHAN